MNLGDGCRLEGITSDCDNGPDLGEAVGHLDSANPHLFRVDVVECFVFCAGSVNGEVGIRGKLEAVLGYVGQVRSLCKTKKMGETGKGWGTGVIFECEGFGGYVSQRGRVIWSLIDSHPGHR